MAVLRHLLSFLASPWHLTLALVPIAIAIWSLRRPLRQNPVSFPATTWLPGAPQSRSSTGRSRTLIRCLALVLLVPLMGGESLVDRTTPAENPGALVLVLDRSSSMSARDLDPDSRLAVVREECRAVVSANPAVELGVVTFAATAELLSPATRDHDSVLEQIDRIRPAPFGEDGTAIGSGLAAAVNALRRVHTEPSRILLVTDGANNRGPVAPLDVAKIAGSVGIRIDAIGIGTDRPSRFLVPSAGGSNVEVEALLEIDEGILSNIAESSGGSFWKARSRKELAAALRAHSSKHADAAAPREAESRVGWPQWLAAVVLALLVLEVLVSDVFFVEIPS